MKKREIIKAIERMSYEDMRSINEALSERWEELNRARKSKLAVGDRVKCQQGSTPAVYGDITKITKTVVCFLADDGRKYKASMPCCSPTNKKAPKNKAKLAKAIQDKFDERRKQEQKMFGILLGGDDAVISSKGKVTKRKRGK